VVEVVGEQVVVGVDDRQVVVGVDKQVVVGIGKWVVGVGKQEAIMVDTQ